MSGFAGAQYEEAHSATRLAEKSRRQVEERRRLFVYALTRPRLSTHGVKKQSVGAPAFDAIT
jgi:hypothetical protein